MKLSKRIRNWYWLQRDRILGKRLAKKEKENFRELRTFAFFLGFPRSGHSLVGSLLDAHPNTSIAHEKDALAYIMRGFDREELYALLLRNARHTARKGRQETGYSYQVPGQYQGSWEKLQLIGDKRGGNSSRWLKARPDLLDRLKGTISEELRVIHVSRNPFDNVATMALRRSKGKNEELDQDLLHEEMEQYLALAGAVEDARSRLEEREFHHLAYEDLLSDPRRTLEEFLRSMDLEPIPAYIEACARVLYQAPHRSRWEVPWSDTLLNELKGRIRDLPLLAPYRFEE